MKVGAPRPRVWLLSVAALVLCAGSAVAGAYAALALATANLENWGVWLRQFAMSPGAAAFAALAAAAIAFAGISKQVRVSRSALDHQRQEASQLAWWRTFEWASGRGLPQGSDDVPLPQAVTISTLENLVKTATTDVQRAACSGLIDALTSRVLPNIDRDDVDAAADAENDSPGAIDALMSYVDASASTAAASSRAEAALYEPRVEAAKYEQTVIAALPGLSSDVRVFLEPPVTDSRTDAIVEIAGRSVAVEVSFARTPMVVRARARSASQHRRIAGLTPLVLVSRFQSPFSDEEEAELRVVVATWNSPADNENLLADIRRASLLGG